MKVKLAVRLLDGQDAVIGRSEGWLELEPGAVLWASPFPSAINNGAPIVTATAAITAVEQL